MAPTPPALRGDPRQPAPRHPARGFIAAGIWFSTLAAFAVVPVLFIAMGTLELYGWSGARV